MRNFSFAYVQKHLPRISPKRIKNTQMDWQYITIHNTVAEYTTANTEYYAISNPLNTSIYGSHILMDENLAIEVIPLDETTFSCGTESSNKTSISIDLCIRPDYEKLLNSAAELISYLLFSKGFDISRLVQHHHWNSKNCPKDLRASNQYKWNLLVSKVQQNLDMYNKQEEIIEYSAELATRQTRTGTVQICLTGLVNLLGGTVTVNHDTKSATAQADRYRLTFYDGSNMVVDKNFFAKPLNDIVNRVNQECFYVPLVKTLEYFGGRNITKRNNGEIWSEFSTFYICIEVGTNILRKVLK